MLNLKAIRQYVGGLISGRSLETPGGSDEWWSFQNPNTKSGTPVNWWTMMAYAPAYRAITLLSRDVGKLPLIVYRKIDDNRGREPDTNHPAYWPLKHKANDYQTSYQWREHMTSDALAWGNGVSAIMRDRPKMQFVPLAPQSVAVKFQSGQLIYEWRPESGGHARILFPSQVVHIRNHTEDGANGLGLITMARESVGLGISTRDYAARFFGEGSIPQIAIEGNAPTIAAETRAAIRNEWQNLYGGGHNWHRPAVLPKDYKVVKIGVDPSQAALTDLWKLTPSDISAFTGVPVHKLGGHESAHRARNSLEEEEQSYLNDALGHWLIQWEQELFCKVLGPNQQSTESHSVAFKTQALLRTDIVKRYQAYNIGVQAGILAPNEPRRWEDLNTPDRELDSPSKPMNMAAVGAAEPQPGKDNANDARSLAIGTLRRELGIYVNDLHKFAKRNGNNWVDSVHEVKPKCDPAALRVLGLDAAVYVRSVQDRALKQLECRADDVLESVRKLPCEVLNDVAPPRP